MKKQKFLLRKLVDTAYLDDVVATVTVETEDNECDIQQKMFYACAVFGEEGGKKEDYLGFIERKMQETYPSFKISKTIKKYKNLLI